MVRGPGRRIIAHLAEGTTGVADSEVEDPHSPDATQAAQVGLIAAILGELRSPAQAGSPINLE
jgi:hypothetical protein